MSAEEYGVQLTIDPDRTGWADAALFFQGFFASTSRTEQRARKTVSIVSRTSFCIAQAFFEVRIRVFYSRGLLFQHRLHCSFVSSIKLKHFIRFEGRKWV